MSNPWTNYVKNNFKKVKKVIEDRGVEAQFGEIMQILSASYQGDQGPVNSCTRDFSEYCNSKGKVCKRNEKRRSCRMPAAERRKKSAGKKSAGKKSAGK